MWLAIKNKRYIEARLQSHRTVKFRVYPTNMPLKKNATMEISENALLVYVVKSKKTVEPCPSVMLHKGTFWSSIEVYAVYFYCA